MDLLIRLRSIRLATTQWKLFKLHLMCNFQKEMLLFYSVLIHHLFLLLVEEVIMVNNKIALFWTPLTTF